MKLRDRVVVITGASSGLGRATALELAARGCALALLARDEDALEDVAVACRERGARTLVVPTDVSSETAVTDAAATVLAELGRVDAWINNAGVTHFAALEQGPFEPHRQVLETNLVGAIYCARAAVPIFRRQRTGILVNVGSVLSEIGHAFAPSYVIGTLPLLGWLAGRLVSYQVAFARRVLGAGAR